MTQRILVIDDEKPIRDSFRMALEDMNVTVETAGSGEEGLGKLDLGPFDLVYLDLKMPGISGIDTLREIRRKAPTLPVYIVTAFADEFFHELRELREDEIEFELMRKPIGQEQIAEYTMAILGKD